MKRIFIMLLAVMLLAVLLLAGCGSGESKQAEGNTSNDRYGHSYKDSDYTYPSYDWGRNGHSYKDPDYTYPSYDWGRNGQSYNP